MRKSRARSSVDRDALSPRPKPGAIEDEAMIRSVAAMLAVLCTSAVTTETVSVRRGEIELASFACTDTPRSTVVRRVCYAAPQHHWLVSVGGASSYCRLPAAMFEAFLSAPSMGQFFRDTIAAAQFACGDRRTN